MAGKSKKSKKKKQNDGKGDGSTVGLAMMPTAAIVAAPRSPPPMPQDLPDFDQGLSTGILGSTIMSHMFNSQDLTDANQPSETDTSLYDYEHAKEAYATLTDMGTTGGTFVLPSPIGFASPGTSQDFSDGEMGAGTMPRGTAFEVIPEDTDDDYPYAKVNKPPKRVRSQDRVDEPDLGRDPSPSGGHQAPSVSMQTYERDDNRALRRKPSDRGRTPSPQSGRHTPVDSRGYDSRRTPSPQGHHSHRSGSRRGTPSGYPRTSSPEFAEVNIESMMTEREFYERKMRSSQVCMPEEDTLVPMCDQHSQYQEYEDICLQPEEEKEELLHSTNPKLLLLEQQNAQLMELIKEQQRKIEGQSEQMNKNYNMQEEIYKKLTEGAEPSQVVKEMGESLRHSQSLTETTLQNHQSLTSSLKNRTRILEQQNDELIEMNEQLQAEINSLHRMTSIKDSGDDVDGSQITMLKKQLQDYRDERDTLKVATHRLSTELSRYQSKYRSPDPDRDTYGLPTQGPIPSWLINTKYLAPLFLAYDDRLAEKDTIIQSCEDELEGFRGRVKDVLRENERLHIRLEQTDVSGPLSMTEWRQLQEQCKLVLEENQLLLEQLDLQQTKTKDMHKAHVQEVARLSKRVVELESEKSELEMNFHEVKHKMTDIKHKYETSVYESHTKVDVEEHVNVLSELKRSQEDERQKLEHEQINLHTKMQGLHAERKVLALQCEDLKAENKQLEAELKASHKAHRKCQRKIMLLQRVLAEVESKEQSANHYLNNVVKMAEKTALERDTFAQAAHKEELKKKKALTKLMAGAVEKEKLLEKLKLYKLKLLEKLQKAEMKMKAQDENFGSTRAEYEREIRHMRLLLKERDELMHMLAGDKKQVEDDLETMWEVATADNRKMRETMRRSMRKLREHAGLSAVLGSDTEDQDVIADILETEH